MENGSTIDSVEQLDAGALDQCVVRTIRQGEHTRAEVRLLEVNGQALIYKDYTRSSPFFSALIAPLLVHRECRALKILGELDGVPRLVRKVSARSFLMEYLPAQRIRFVREDIPWPQFLAATESLVAAINTRGVVHGDLRNATNILVADDMSPVFVDFASAAFRGHKLNPIGWMMFHLCKPIDEGAMFKLRDKYAPETVSLEQRNAREHSGALERSARWLSVRIRNLIKRISP